MKSSYSGNDGGNCIEIAPAIPDVVPVRDSKTPDGPALAFDRSAWSSFVSAIQRDQFNA
ncbi:DUF397 domain-containing protein [Streptomyces sp. TRM49041]|uniref:DUF397 domain-containing protein n=1 Tax=Streptomyces sp. TRM49041 TaxID=2603216 RepID=UPI0021CCC613|nr:DUF397 domain-containing protein [Streptomyces sp. TRM49041]